MTAPRTILRKRGIRPQKRLGQSFLEDLNIMNKIVGVADIQSDDIVVEIGAGLGVMTDIIARQAGRVIAVEIDRRLVSLLSETLRDRTNVLIVNADILDYDFSALYRQFPSRKLKIVGNIPYYASSQILFRLLAARNVIQSMVLMLQKEMAQRITAKPGTRQYGIPTVLIAMYAAASCEITVSRNCFFPRPKVDSSVLKILIREASLTRLCNDDVFSKLVHDAFSQRRKTLLNNLKNSDWLLRRGADAASLLAAAGVDGRRRAETLSAEEFGNLSNTLARME